MSTSSSARRGQFWRPDWFLGVAVVVAVMVLHPATGFIGTLERRCCDHASSASARQPPERIASVGVEGETIVRMAGLSEPQTGW